MAKGWKDKTPRESGAKKQTNDNKEINKISQKEKPDKNSKWV